VNPLLDRGLPAPGYLDTPTIPYFDTQPPQELLFDASKTKRDDLIRFRKENPGIKRVVPLIEDEISVDMFAIPDQRPIVSDD
jgi:hypothetical protein